MITAEVTGLEDIRTKLKELIPKDAKAVLRRTMLASAKNIRNFARTNAPERTKRLKKAIVSKRDRGTRTSIESSVWVTHGKGVRNSAFYWRFPEFGTRRIAATPFLFPAFERGKRMFLKFFRNEFFGQLAKQVAKRGK